MKKIAFCSSITGEKSQWKYTAFVDEYFVLFSGRRYRVIDTHNRDKREYKVVQDKKEHRQSYLVVAFKIASYCTVILPLIMAVSKLILRSYYTFYDVSSSDLPLQHQILSQSGDNITNTKNSQRPNEQLDVTQNDLSTKPVIKLEEAKKKLEAMLKFKVPKEIEKTLPMEFISDVFFSGDYSEKEIETLIKCFHWEYSDIQRGTAVGFAQPTRWTSEATTKAYLQSLSNLHPSFGAYRRQIMSRESWLAFMRSIGCTRSDQFKLLPLEKVTPEIYHSIESKRIADHLPELNEAKALYGFALAVNGNTHRTAFVIDTQRCRVEYYNSFGSDSNAKELLIALTKALTDKYGKPFTYHHQTSSSCLQKDGYQCGIWACKFIEERIKGPYDVSSLRSEANKIALYRQHVSREAFKESFFYEIAEGRLLPFFPSLHLPSLPILTWGEKQVKAWGKGHLPVDDPASQIDQFNRHVRQ